MRAIGCVMPTVALTLPVPECAESGRKIKDKARASAWRRDLAQRLGAALSTASPQMAAEIEQAYERELERGPGFSRVRRNAKFVEPVVRPVDRNALARALWVAEQISKGFWRSDRKAAKESGRRVRRTISRSALDVLRALARLTVKHNGRVFPSLEGLAYLASLSRRTVVRAIKELEGLGVVEITRRAKRIATPFGMKQVQATSVYAIRPEPIGFGAMAAAIFGVRGSECQTGPARNPTTTSSDNRSAERPQSPLTPLSEQAPNGTRISWQSLIRPRR